ncbi:hypothetical protein EQG49_02565 [Periweissella cryptocerci]|uniref:Uncharacterized protein n=1 Tax=Periweissella cryptocerci TaxID=2506420 RepID=A0A4P6YS17_9LACO|nr:hypothetical protein [Periweissella cryptocerci]QBO35426.1 hypothetical protein EQG49_02565 [Periweissella cryptocerci]
MANPVGSSYVLTANNNKIASGTFVNDEVRIKVKPFKVGTVLKLSVYSDGELVDSDTVKVRNVPKPKIKLNKITYGDQKISGIGGTFDPSFDTSTKITVKHGSTVLGSTTVKNVCKFSIKLKKTLGSKWKLQIIAKDTVIGGQMTKNIRTPKQPSAKYKYIVTSDFYIYKVRNDHEPKPFYIRRGTYLTKAQMSASYGYVIEWKGHKGTNNYFYATYYDADKHWKCIN